MIWSLALKYWKQIAILGLAAGIYLYAHHAGYYKAETKYKLQRAKEVEAELLKVKSIEAKLKTERARAYELESKLDEDIKSDPSYSCTVPDSLRTYLNSI